MERRFLIISMCLQFSVLPLLAQNDFIIIVNKSASGVTLNRADIESIFLGKKTRWNDGSKIIPVTMKEGEVHESFIKNMIRKSTNAYMNYWRKMIFTGQGVMPLAYEKETDILKYVNETHGAIGYISKTTGTGGYDSIVPLTVSE